MQISERYGTIREWIMDYEGTEPGHRHISRLFGLFPADRINESDPEIYEATKRTIARRIEDGGGIAGIKEMLLQSYEGSLDERSSELLPAGEKISLTN